MTSTEPTGPPDPEELTGAAAPVTAELPAATSLGAVHLSVADLARSIAFYEDVLGLLVLDQGAGRVVLGVAGRALVVLEEEPGARPAARASGLFHVALRVPERADLARWLAHVARERHPISGLSDHRVSEAIYLDDPDRHGIEIYCDRPRAQWEGRVLELLATLPLDVDDLLATLADPATEPFDGLAAGTVMGHVHLRVSAVPDAVAFYRDVLGFGLMAQLGNEAAFLGAAGYHHHIGANTWQSRGAPQPPPGTATLLRATIVLPDAATYDSVLGRVASSGQEPVPTPTGMAVRDPAGNPLELQVALA